MTTGNGSGNGLNGSGNPLIYPCVQDFGLDSLCVYLGSNPGLDPTFAPAVEVVADIIVDNRIRLINGGGGRGLMQKLVNRVLQRGGRATCVTPEDLLGAEGGAKIPWIIDVRRVSDFDEVVAILLPQLAKRDDSVQIIVKEMGIRKKLMYVFAKGFVALPGGIGTLEELVEQLTWKQLGRHNKPICIYNHVYNHSGFWDKQLEVFRHMRDLQLITEQQPIEYVVAHQVDQIIPMLCGEMESLGRVNKRPLIHPLFGVPANGQISTQS